MKRHRGNAVLLVTLFLLVLLGVAFYLFTPRRDLGDVRTHVVDTMVATFDGLLHRLGIPTPERSAWNAAPVLLGVVLGVLLARRRSPRP
jgi:hypothetical protein